MEIAGKFWLKTDVLELAFLALEGHRGHPGLRVPKVYRVNLGRKVRPVQRVLKVIPATKARQVHKGNRDRPANRDRPEKLGLKDRQVSKDHKESQVLLALKATRETLEHFPTLCRWGSVNSHVENIVGRLNQLQM